MQVVVPAQGWTWVAGLVPTASPRQLRFSPPQLSLWLPHLSFVLGTGSFSPAFPAVEKGKAFAWVKLWRQYQGRSVCGKL